MQREKEWWKIIQQRILPTSLAILIYNSKEEQLEIEYINKKAKTMLNFSSNEQFITVLKNT